MGKHFGNLYKLRGLVYYRLSPYEISPFKGFITKGFPNLFRRMYEEVFFVVPPFAVAYVIYKSMKEENERLSRKNPADFANDE